jgi:hypothetical protein
MRSPKVFVSHASKDKERFVFDFATKLRSQGIDAKVDRWEILPGDSLVDKIFEEGIGQAQAVIVVVSEHSVDRPWVREELNAATVRRIEGASKLIPVVIGNVDESRIPVSLKALAWERVRDLNSYDAELSRIVMSIYGRYEKPPIGEPPAYTQSSINIVPGLNEVDSLILELCCQELIERNEGDLRFKPEWLYEAVEPLGVHRESALESLRILDGRGYIKAQTTINGSLYDFRVSGYGFEEYARSSMPDYGSLVRSVALQIINFERWTDEQIANDLGQPPLIIRHVLGVLQNRGFITVQKVWGGPTRITSTSHELKRWLQET